MLKKKRGTCVHFFIWGVLRKPYTGDVATVHAICVEASMFSCRIHRNFSGFQMQDEHNCFVFIYVMPGRCPRCVALRRMHHHAAKIQNILYLQALWQKNLHLKLGLVVTKGCPKFVDALTSPRRRIDEPPSTH